LVKKKPTMSGLNKQNADHAYRNLLVNDTALINSLVSRTLNNISTSGQIDTSEVISGVIIADSVSALSVSADAYASPFGSVSADWGTPGSISVTNNALVGKILLTNVAPGSPSRTITVLNTNISAGDLVFLTQSSFTGVPYFTTLFVLTVFDGQVSITVTPSSGGKATAVEIGYFVVKNSA
jgi:hypothetical protein